MIFCQERFVVFDVAKEEGNLRSNLSQQLGPLLDERCDLGECCHLSVIELPPEILLHQRPNRGYERRPDPTL